MTLSTYISTTHQLPMIIAELLCSQRPGVIIPYNSELKKKLLNIYTKELFQDLVTISNKESVYVNSIENTSDYPINSIVNFVGIEQKLKEEQFRKKSRIISSINMYPSDTNPNKMKILIFGNSILRAHFNLDTFPSLEDYTCISPGVEMRSNDELIVFSAIKDLLELYRYLNGTNMENAFFYHANLKHNVTAIHNPFSYLICALTMATMESIYLKITNMDDLYQIQDFERNSQTNKFHIAMRKILRCIILTEYRYDFAAIPKLEYQKENIKFMRIITRLAAYFVDITRNNDYLTQIADVLGIIEDEKGEEAVGND